MRLLTAFIFTCVVLSACEANSLSDKLKEFLENFKNKSANLRDDLKEVGGALGSVAKDTAKSFAGQIGQALIGAFLNSFKGFDLGKIVFGKRDLGHFYELPVRVDESISKLVEKSQQTLEEIYTRTFAKFAAIIKSLVELRPEEDVKSQLEKIHSEHELAVRGVLGDTLNTGIDAIKRLWYKFKGIVLGDKQEVSDPVMIGRRGLLDDAWKSFMGKVQSLKEKIMPHYVHATEVTKNIAAALKHHGGNMVEQVKEKAVAKMHETLGYLAGSLKQHLSNAKSTFEAVKQELANTVESLMYDN